MYRHGGHKGINSKTLASYCISHTTPIASILPKSKDMYDQYVNYTKYEVTEDGESSLVNSLCFLS